MFKEYQETFTYDQKVMIKNNGPSFPGPSFPSAVLRRSPRKLQVPPLGPSSAPRHSVTHKGPTAALPNATAFPWIPKARGRAPAEQLST